MRRALRWIASARSSSSSATRIAPWPSRTSRASQLTFGPSPVHRLDRLSEHLGGEVEIWAKREDCNSGLAYGGNKMRKLEYLAADALAQGCDTLVSIGGVQSNHTRQVAAVAAHLGLGCVLVQEHWVDWDDPATSRSATSCSRGSWARTSGCPPPGFDIGFRPSWEEALASEVRGRGGKPYAIPAGASDHPLGGHGFARWADEVAEQEAELGVFFDTVVVCSVTGSTQAGMIAGFAAQERSERCSGSTARRRSSRRGSRSRGSRGAQRRRSGSGASSTTRRSSSSTSGTRAPTASPTRRRSTRFASAPGSRACSPTRSTRASRWPR